MELALSLKIDRRLGNTAESAMPTLEAVTGAIELKDLISPDGTVPGQVIANLEYYWFKKGFRPCDTVIQYRGHRRAPIWKLEPTGVIRPFTEKSCRRRQATRGIDIEKIPITASEFWAIVLNLCKFIQPAEYKLTREMELVLADNPDGVNLYDLLIEGSQGPPASKVAKLLDRFVRMFFCKGHKFGKTEQSLMSMQTMLLCFSELRFGLFSNVSFGKFWLLASLGSTTTLTKQYKAWTTNREHFLFEFIGETPNVPEPVVEVYQHSLDNFFLHDPVFQFVGEDGLDDKVFEVTGRWLQYFVPSRTLPCPDEAAVAEEYVKYTNFLTSRTHIGTHATAEEVKEWTTGPLGAQIEDFLSSCLASSIARKASQYPDGRAAQVLQGLSTPTIPLGTTSNFSHSRKKGGHYGTNAEFVLPFLELEIGEAFPFIMETEDGETFVCDDHGQPLCPERLSGDKVWQVAYADSNEFERDMKILERARANSKKTDRVGLDSRYGNCLHLYSTWATREWREAAARLQDEFKYDSLTTEDELRDLVKLHGLKIPKERTVPILEPGGKTRWVSAAEGALLYYQYPLAEDLRSLYTEVDAAKVGLTQDNHLFRFEQSFADHTLDKILRPKNFGITPSSINEIKLDLEEAEGDETDFRVAVTVNVARAIASTYKIHPLAALVSLCPRGGQVFHERLLSSIKIDSGFIHNAINYNVASYKDVDRQVLLEPTLRWQIIVITTTDMVKATDTFLHGPLRKNLTSVLAHLGIQ